ncbi:hypothetical protein HU830_03160 [Lactobacillus sp. DCY120]|uniref:Uncharacterized protein n=1 Tax=Bombilactobacillus apium TaxID=2675299 RepID=A0A850R6K5_9LACO|nr:hypothetical protein [Bombilactobacillus apium]NVY96175.1 hypothetical protein [Bombilactobacillus apium]
MKVIDSKFQFIRYNKKIALYNIKKFEIDKVLSLPEQMTDYFLMLNDDNNWGHYTKENIILNKVINFIESNMANVIVSVDEREYRRRILQQNFINNFVNKNNDNYELNSDQIKINLKRMLYFEPILGIGSDIKFNLFNNFRSRVDYKNNDIYRHDPIFIINLNIGRERLVSMEKVFTSQPSKRIYYGIQDGDLIIGPGLCGEDYGCLFCGHNIFNENHFLNDNYGFIDNIIQGLLQEEVLKFNSNLLSFMKKDTTLTKGKYFDLSLVDYSAFDKYLSRNSHCKLCGID